MQRLRMEQQRHNHQLLEIDPTTLLLPGCWSEETLLHHKRKLHQLPDFCVQLVQRRLGLDLEVPIDTLGRNFSSFSLTLRDLRLVFARFYADELLHRQSPLFWIWSEWLLEFVFIKSSFGSAIQFSWR